MAPEIPGIGATSRQATPAIQPLSIAKRREKEMLLGEEKPQEAIMLFASITQAAHEAPRLSASSKASDEHTRAAVVSTAPPNQIFTINSEGKFVAVGRQHVSRTETKTDLASALAGTENNQGSGDKRHGGNTFSSKHKDLKDARMERLRILV